MEELIDDYVAFELFEESLCEATDIACPACESSLLFDPEREIYLCPECRDEGN
jgi:DNA-directed RNA polymerase subunit RPC12/RpoP